MGALGSMNVSCLAELMEPRKLAHITTNVAHLGHAIFYVFLL